ncbi:DUF4386 domain-containing protein [Paraflavitalea soli]|uniref:DUF4386 domain-containing protein n=1 Tax=Paraflavitalea soli TaxID=2315862 RepID=A0A3B7MIR8_9BACT|nr:DUF4386 domain-containing protein [Paraflavitalea soli]AXY74334.1 DUF4386 domain-containing protein [Paraflavitalea soli]
MYSIKRTARLAGLIYLVVVVTGIFSLAYVPSKLIDWKDAAKTVQQITASESLFRWGIASSILCYIAFLGLPLALYQLLKPVHEQAAKLMVILAIVSVPISFLNMQHKFEVLTLIKGAEHLQIFDSVQIASQVMAQLSAYDDGLLIVTVFWGLWLLPFGFLVYHSGMLPKVWGVLLVLGCFGYLINFFGRVLIPDFGEMFIARYITRPASLGEIGTCLWLLIMGARNRPGFLAPEAVISR